MYRDVNQYKNGEKESTYTRDWFDPFMPYNGYNGSKDDTVKMKPAPSGETAYYLVEDVQPDWDSSKTPTSRACPPRVRNLTAKMQARTQTPRNLIPNRMPPLGL